MLVFGLSKIFDKIFLSYFVAFLNKCDSSAVLDPSQHGFRPGNCTEPALFDFTDAVLEALDGSQMTVGCLL